MEEINSTNISLDDISNLCASFPEQCFVRIVLVWQDEYYSNISYTSIPYEMNFRDINATYNYSFIEVNEDDGVLDCFDGYEIQPIEFNYDGYLFTSDLNDSLWVENLNCEFMIFPFF